MSYDVAIFQNAPDGSVMQTMASTFNNGYVVTGKSKLVQRFVIELLTERGSLSYLPDRGCSFVTLLRKGTTGTWDLMSAFSSSLLDVISNLSAEDKVTNTTDPTEMLSTVELISLLVDPGLISLQVRLSNQANERFDITIPLDFMNF